MGASQQLRAGHLLAKSHHCHLPDLACAVVPCSSSPRRTALGLLLPRQDCFPRRPRLSSQHRPLLQAIAVSARSGESLHPGLVPGTRSPRRPTGDRQFHRRPPLLLRAGTTTSASPAPASVREEETAVATAALTAPPPLVRSNQPSRPAFAKAQPNSPSSSAQPRLHRPGPQPVVSSPVPSDSACHVFFLFWANLSIYPESAVLQ